MMRNKKDITIGFPHKPNVCGGPGSFQIRITKKFREYGWKVVFPEDAIIPDVILVIGATSKLYWLWKCRRRGARIVYRLDGLNWRYRFTSVSIREKILPIIHDVLKRIIRGIFADAVVYQSEFVQKWWHKKYGRAQ